MVEDNVIKLELKRVRDALYKTADGVVGLEKEKIQMETAMRERREEIRIHVEMLRHQMKASDTERHGVNAELHDRLGRIDKLKKRSVDSHAARLKRPLLSNDVSVCLSVCL